MLVWNRNRFKLLFLKHSINVLVFLLNHLLFEWLCYGCLSPHAIILLLDFPRNIRRQYKKCCNRCNMLTLAFSSLSSQLNSLLYYILFPSTYEIELDFRFRRFFRCHNINNSLFLFLWSLWLYSFKSLQKLLSFSFLRVNRLHFFVLTRTMIFFLTIILQFYPELIWCNLLFCTTLLIFLINRMPPK